MSSVNSTISLGIQPADGTCGASSTSAGGQVEVTNLALTLSTMSIESGKHFGGAGFGTTSMVNAVAHDFTTLNYATSTTAGLSAGLTTIYYIRKFTPPSTGALPAVGDAIRAQITVTYQCSFSGGVATTDQSIDMLFTYNGSVWNQTTFAPG